jgi:hypothetical protein
LLRADPQSFVCEEDHVRVPDTCLEQRRAVSECQAPGSGACFDQCVRQAAECHVRLSDCEAGCHAPNPDCRQVDIAYETCLLDFPVECREPFEPDTREEQDIPCFDEALSVLACAKF